MVVRFDRVVMGCQCCQDFRIVKGFRGVRVVKGVRIFRGVSVVRGVRVFRDVRRSVKGFNVNKIKQNIFDRVCAWSVNEMKLKIYLNHNDTRIRDECFY